MIKLKINGQDQNWDGDPDLSLLWYLRDEAGLTGTKFGCGQALCGTLVTSNHIRADANARDEHNKNASLRSRPLRNLPMLTGFTGGPTEWRGGSVYNPADGGTYRGTITMTNDDTLRLRGCIVAPLCKTQTWTRVQ